MDENRMKAIEKSLSDLGGQVSMGNEQIERLKKTFNESLDTLKTNMASNTSRLDTIDWNTTLAIVVGALVYRVGMTVLVSVQPEWLDPYWIASLSLTAVQLLVQSTIVYRHVMSMNAGERFKTRAQFLIGMISVSLAAMKVAELVLRRDEFSKQELELLLSQNIATLVVNSLFFLYSGRSMWMLGSVTAEVVSSSVVTA